MILQGIITEELKIDYKSPKLLHWLAIILYTIITILHDLLITASGQAETLDWIIL